jgi:hypothetical protein
MMTTPNFVGFDLPYDGGCTNPDSGFSVTVIGRGRRSPSALTLHVA